MISSAMLKMRKLFAMGIGILALSGIVFYPMVNGFADDNKKSGNEIHGLQVAKKGNETEKPEGPQDENEIPGLQIAKNGNETEKPEGPQDENEIPGLQIAKNGNETEKPEGPQDENEIPGLQVA